MKNKFYKQNKGITLIALVITIIVLLILAGVAISMLAGDNGILRQAASAKDDMAKASEFETVKLAAMAGLTAGQGKMNLDVLNSELTEIAGKEIKIEKLPATVTIGDNSYTIEEDGTVSIPSEEDTPVEVTIASLIESGETVEKITTIEEDDGDVITIPEKFKVSKDSGLTVEEGIVVISPDGSEFVWVPVPDVIYDETTEIKVGEYTPMARLQNGTTNYQGVLYDLNQAAGSQAVYSLTTYGVGTSNYREPSLVTGNRVDNYAELETVKGESYDNGTDTSVEPNKKYYELAGYSSIQAFGKDMQEEYDNMVESVNKYKGFYVGRYETGIENGKVVSKNAYTNEGVTTADASQDTTKYWYGLYNKQRTMAKDNSLTGVESSMIWGSQYDAMMNWMIKTGNVVGTGYDSDKCSSVIKVTGESENDIINKIHDLYGCNNEWSLEAYDATMWSRVSRGGRYNKNRAPGARNHNTPNSANYSYIGSRLTLYIESN